MVLLPFVILCASVGMGVASHKSGADFYIQSGAPRNRRVL